MAKSEFHKIRNDLKQIGLIGYEKGKKGQAGTYSIIPLYRNNTETNQETNPETNPRTNPETNPRDINKHKQNINETNKEAAADARENAVVFFEKNFGITSPFIIEQIEAWVNDFDSDEIVIAAMKIALKKGANSFGYCEPILKEWYQKGLRTIDAIRAYEANKQTKSKRINKRVESIPKWMTDPNWGKTETSEEEIQKRVKDLEGLLSNL
jgi:DnaD/phage-associated family protein